jgi:MoaA/NifB/PqqE/SkfB family radical SAM enzyme
METSMNEQSSAAIPQNQQMTTAEAMDRAIASHRAGRLQEAERLYRAILKQHPTHPDANHNLGVLAVSIDRIDDALPLFKAALRANGTVTQFWLSYVNALVRCGRMEDAQAVLAQARAQGLDEAGYQVLAKRLALSGQVQSLQAGGMKPLVAVLGEQVTAPFFPRVPNISLELTNKCNMLCPYCANGSLTRDKGYIEWDLLEKIVTDAGANGLNISHLHGVGEPLLWDRLEDVIRLVRTHDAGEATFGTNGSLMTRDRARSLLEAGLQSVYFSVDSLDPAIYKNTRGGNLEKVIANIKDFLDFAPDDFPVIIALMDHKDQTIDEKALAKYKEIVGDRNNVTLNRVENSFFPSAREDYRRRPEKRASCMAPVNYLFIDYRGNAAVCCLDQDVLHSLGNVGERGISDVWFDPVNQTHFRNMALGVKDVPHACVKHCILKEPRQDMTEAPIGLALPFSEALSMAKVLSYNKMHIEAARVLRGLQLRDPRNSEVGKLLATQHTAVR